MPPRFRFERYEGSTGSVTTRSAPTDSEAFDSGSIPAKRRSSSGAVEGLLLEQELREAVERGAVLREQAERLLIGVVGQACLLLVSHLLRDLGEGVVVGAHRARGHRVAHAELEDHASGELGHPLEVVGSPVRDRAEDDLLGRAPGKHDLHEVEELLLRVEVPVFLGRVERVAEGGAARDDGHLLDGLRVADEVRHERVATLVVGEDPLLLLGDDAPLLEPGDDPLYRRLEVGLADELLLRAAGENGGLVADVGEVGAREAGGLSRNLSQVDVGSERLPAGVDGEDVLASGDIGRRDEDLPVEAARP